MFAANRTSVAQVETVGEHSIEVYVGPEDFNPNFGTQSQRLGDRVPFFPVAYAAPTVRAEVEFVGEAGLGAGTAGFESVLDILPLDRFNNLQDYVASPADDFLVNVTVNSLRVIQASLERKVGQQEAPRATRT